MRLSVLLVLTMAAGVLGGCAATTRAGGSERTRPTAVDARQVDPATLRFVQLSTRNSHVCAITAEGIAYCWGGNYAGQLGTGARRGGGPVAGGLAFSQISAGIEHTCGVTKHGEAYCWGSNRAGRLGTGDTVATPVPRLVAGGLRFLAVDAGSSHTCGLTAEGEAYCWGTNSGGQLGVPPTENCHFVSSAVERNRSKRVLLILPCSTRPVRVSGGHRFRELAVGYHTCGWTADGNVYCWGPPYAYDPSSATGDSLVYLPVAVSSDIKFASVSVGMATTCGVGVDGRGYCWGLNGELGIFGTGDTVSRATPTPIAGGLTYASISVGMFHACGVTTAGVAYCWGGDATGNLGVGDNGRRLVPTAVVGGLTFSQVVAGNFLSCGITTGGATYCWGSGNGVAGFYAGHRSGILSAPVLVAGVPAGARP